MVLGRERDGSEQRETCKVSSGRSNTSPTTRRETTFGGHGPPTVENKGRPGSHFFEFRCFEY